MYLIIEKVGFFNIHGTHFEYQYKSSCMYYIILSKTLGFAKVSHHGRVTLFPLIFVITEIIMAALPEIIEPYAFNYIFNVNFYKDRNLHYRDVLANYGRFTATIRSLKIKEGCYLLKSGKQDIRGLTFAEYDQYLPKEDGSLVQWVVISQAHDLDLVFNREMRVSFCI